MAIVRAFEIGGTRMWFWSDDHEPPHFHAKKTGEWEVTVRFMLGPAQMIEVKWAEKSPSRRLLREICAKAEEHRVELFEQWQEIQGI